MKKYLIIFIIALLSICSGLYYALKKEKEESKRLEGNQTALLSDVHYYRTQDSLSAASVLRLELTKSEFKNHFEKQEEVIKSLNIKLSRVKSVTTTATETKIPIRAQLKDSLVRRDSLVLLKCIDLHTPYLDLSGCLENNQLVGDIAIRDTLTHVVHRIPKKFLFFRFGTKAIRLEVVSTNPFTQLKYARYIELK